MRWRWVGVAMLATTLFLLALDQAAQIQGIGQNLSPTADPYSEANALRAAQHYNQHGFFTDYGLPHIVYGDRFPADGWTRNLADHPLPNGVYTRLPPTAEWLCGVYEKIFGPHRRELFRAVPVTLSLAAIAFAFHRLARVLHPIVAAAAIALLSIVPALRTHMHGLHFEGYAHALLLLALALSTEWALDGRPWTPKRYAALFGLGFAQGALSFEYAFAAVFASAPVLVLARAHGAPIGRRTLVLASVASGSGYTAAVLLHFAQVALFYGSARRAFADFGSRAVYRFTGGTGEPYGAQVVSATREYARELFVPSAARHFGLYLPIALVVVVVVTFARRRHHRATESFASFGLAFVVGFVWILALPSHAAIHPHIVPRVFFVAYYVLIVALCLNLPSARARA